jgi:hypothetical protein
MRTSQSHQNHIAIATKLHKSIIPNHQCSNPRLPQGPSLKSYPQSVLKFLSDLQIEVNQKIHRPPTPKELTIPQIYPTIGYHSFLKITFPKTLHVEINVLFKITKSPFILNVSLLNNKSNFTSGANKA